MLQNIRDNTQGLIAKFIIGLIIIPFALFGIDSLVGGSGPSKVATVGDTEITMAELEQAINLERRRLMNAMGDNLDPSMLDEKLLRAPSLERLIQQKLLLETASEAGLGIDTNTVDQTIVQTEQFQVDGKFSPDRYKNVLRTNGYTPAYFKQLLTNDMVIQQMNAGVAGSNFVTQQELDQVAAIVGQKRSFRYLLLPKEKVLSQVSISDEEVQDYYDSNLDQFMTEAVVKLEYIEVKQEDFVEPISEAELRQAYELELKGFNAIEERRAAHILISNEGERDDEAAEQLAKEIAAKLNEGEKFTELAMQYSDDLGSSNSGGDLGFTTGDTFPAEFEEVLFSLNQGQVSEPVKTDAGYHLIKATEIKADDRPAFEDRKAIIEQRLQLAAAEGEFVSIIESLRDLVFNSEGLSGPAKELELELSTSDFVGRQSATGVLAKSQVIGAAFSSDVLEEGNNSEVIELSPDHFIVVHVLDSRKPEPKPLKAVQDQILAALNQRKATELSLSMAEELIADLASGKAMEDLARESGYEWQVEMSVSRNSANVSRQLLAAVFAMPEVEQGAVYREAVDLNSGNIAIVQLDGVDEGQWQQLTSNEQQSLRLELLRVAESSSLKNMLDSLRTRMDIEVL